MKPAVVLLGLILLLDVAFAAEESCVGRCGSFDTQKKCQCDSMCVYYGSCCADFDTICPKKISRGDTFGVAEDLTTAAPTFNTIPVTVTDLPTMPPTHGSTPHVDPNAAHCSGRPFDAFLQLKNGSIFAFRGEYFFELDDKAILPGYPKLIEDVWGISGPIDAAFTRINCQGKTYIFKGNKYWRFEGDVLDEDYPRNISVGFDGIPDNVDAAFAIPAASHRGKEKVYFFKDDKYYQYEFRHQPSHEECVRMSRSSPSVLFTQYTDLFCDQTWEDFFTELFGGSVTSDDTSPGFISKGWSGIRAPVDAAMVGRVYLSPKPTKAPSPPPPSRRRSSRKRKTSRRRGHKRRQSRYAIFDDLFGYDDLWDLGDLFDYSDYSDYSHHSDTTDKTTTQEYQSTPVQNVYFFKRDKYYRVDLQTKRVAFVASPAYPRSIAKYWLGCEHEETPDTSRAEKK